MLLDFFLVIFGFVALLFGGELLVRGGVNTARKLGVRPFIIGLTLVAFGTSAPELMVSIRALLIGHADIVMGNAIGSNIANILLVIGVSALITPISGGLLGPRPQASFLFGVTFIFGCFSLGGTFVWYHGLLMVVFLLTYFNWSFKREEPSATERNLLPEEIPDSLGTLKKISESSALPIIFMVCGMALLLLGAQFLVEGSVSVARKMGVSEAVIGLSLIAIGTSLPELATSLIASYRGHMSLAVGNIVGSNIFNLFGVVGITSLIDVVPVPLEIITIDLWVMGGATIVLCGFMLVGCAITRSAGAGLFMLYAVYMCHLWVR
ncbi:MAG: calcium/sodium antiporter [Pseudomonadota bacterium]|nr:calcium/sodium antiporter [Pseudomonadota bacterium]